MRVYTACDKYELLELFECEPKVVDEDAEIYVYTSINKYGFKFELYLSIYDMSTILTLTYKDFNDPIIDISITNVKKINAGSKKLNIYTSENDWPNTVIFFEPSFRIQLPNKTLQ